ncbi:hypothetical protein HK105_206746 [Polyrhizophydium stewartii]|uniref:Sepiapterin reductase n=1 Tax=Polyrhizophydium stewartii TaxID=2732419 RepID=A0ABR4N2K6_9FUNG
MAARSLFIITGASRGFGRSIALALADSPLVTAQPTDIVLAARSVDGLHETQRAVERIFNEADVTTRHPLALHVCAVDFGSPTVDVACDLVVSRTVPHPPGAYHSVTLVNNAGSLGRLARIRDQTLEDVRRNLELNVTAPLVLTAAFLKRFASECARTVVVNVSSLAAVQPFDTWGVYSANKAARDMFHRVVALEEGIIEAEETLPGIVERAGNDETLGTAPARHGRVRVLNYAPGPLDTDMQARIRAEMPNVQLRQVYVKMHDEGRLVDPNDSAKVLVSMLESDDYDNGAHVDFYDVQQHHASKTTLVGK